MSITDVRSREALPLTVASRQPAVDDRAIVAAMLDRLDAAWRERRYRALADCFDEEVVMMLPGGTGRVVGRAAVVDSYRDFMESAIVTEYHEDPAMIDVWGDTAVASYRWAMSWVSNGKSDSGAGCDILVFRRFDDDEWRVVWRTMSLEPAPE